MTKFFSWLFLLITVTLILLMASGCSSFEKQFENRVSCAVGERKAFINSFYGVIGLTSKVESKDSEFICSKEKL